MATPTVTIGLPFVDEYSTLVHAIRSVFAQTATDWELLLVQDGADRRSRELTEAIDDQRVTVIADGHQRGLAARLNEIARHSQGEILMRMDADDVMVPWRVQRTVAEFRAADSPLVASHAYVIDELGNVHGLYGQLATPTRPIDYLLTTPYIHPTVAGLRSWFLSNPYNEAIRRAEDKELWLRTHRQSPVKIVAEPLLFYRVPRTMPLSKMLRTSHDDRAVMRQLHREVVFSSPDNSSFVARLLRSYAADLVAVCAHSVRATEWIAERKQKPLSLADQKKATAILESTQAQVPGWD